MSLRDWTKKSGTFKIGELTTNDSVLRHLTTGTKYLECLSSSGDFVIPFKQAYGVWEFDVLSNNITQFVTLSFVDQNNGYKILFGYRNGVYKIASGSDSILFRTSPNPITTNVWYSIKVTRTSFGEFTMYIKGGAYGNNWTLVSVTGGTGTNPVTDTNYFNAKIALFGLKVGDKIANIKFYDGVRV